ncbi:MAG: glycoside hydrolase family 3 C-terminal domain-containing protein, partial [Anaerolineae bacterium]|nr:glycoside hydrolase family 3 C-terminal domain-containing protein [Anaerolineae bacterium]
VVVLMNGSAIAATWADAHAAAVVELWYPGEEGGTALADVLFGDTNPAGRLPVTFYQSVDDLPPFRDYRMEGHTYRYFRGAPLYPFGHGLSYTTFAYSNLVASALAIAPGDGVEVMVTVQNTGECAGDEVVQLYLKDRQASVPVPKHQLVGFRRIHLTPGQVHQLTFTIEPKQMSVTLDDGSRVIEPGIFDLFVGGGQPNTGAAGVSATVEVVGGAPQ